MASVEERAIEAIVMVSEQPVEVHLLAQLLEVTPARVEEICDRLARSYTEEDRGFRLVRVAGGYRYQSAPDEAPYVERFVLDGQSARLSAAALETLAIVAYKQPVSRAQVAAIRGVSADAVVRTLQTRGYIMEVGRDPGPGQATLYGTSPLFLEKLGLDSLAQLPALAQFVPGAEIMETLERSLRADPDPEPGFDGGPAGAREGPDSERPDSEGPDSEGPDSDRPDSEGPGRGGVEAWDGEAGPVPDLGIDDLA